MPKLTKEECRAMADSVDNWGGGCGSYSRNAIGVIRGLEYHKKYG